MPCGARRPIDLGFTNGDVGPAPRVPRTPPMLSDIDEFIERNLALLALGKLTLVSPPREPDRIWYPGPRSGIPGCVVRWVRPELRAEFPRTEIRKYGRPSSAGETAWPTAFPSRKAGRVLYGQSKLERRHMRDVEFDRDAIAMCDQPMSIEVPGMVPIRPDAFVWMRDGPHEIREVKPEGKARLKEDRWEAIGTAVASIGYVYRVVTEVRLDHPPRSANVSLFMSARHAEPPAEDALDAMWDFLSGGPLHAGEILARFTDLKRKQLMALVRLQFFAMVDLDCPFDDGSLLERRTRNIQRVAAAYRSDCGPRRRPFSANCAEG